MRPALLARSGLLATCLALSACAAYPQFVMLNPRTGATVECQQPDMAAGPADFLVSRACLSACQAHGFRPVPGMPARPGNADIPDQCSN